MDYTDIVLDHARNPRNVGFIEDHDGMGTYGDPNCGDFAVMTIKVWGERLTDVRYLVRGCGAAIATCSMASELVKGKPLPEAQKLTDEDVTGALGGLPPEKLHCSNLAASALHNAIEDYYQRQRVDLHNWRALYQRRTG
ncbi:MAG: iron-sulfur cluster assembly scaffold protein [Anaerolineae bacterium]|jgi:nitrogen fixation NifU-like protein|nr:iron-sulfur cluster assembly scaffold protein [Anaerolineae bacterium]MDH7472803.1 iron-sulfur cluster assembly scaffold protein [Anaerolineae bacterium]